MVALLGMRFLAFVSVALASALAADVEFTLNITNAVVARECVILYGCLGTYLCPAADGFERRGVIVNGQHPGTFIQGREKSFAWVIAELLLTFSTPANKTDTLKLNVWNFLDDPDMRRSTSIHWHGLFQMRTATEDGRESEIDLTCRLTLTSKF